jgi:hypothetical protein
VPKSSFSFFSVEFIDECLGLEQPVESEEERTSNAAERAASERLNASVSQVVRKSDRCSKGICFSKGLPADRKGTYTCGHGESKNQKSESRPAAGRRRPAAKKQILWDHDPHRLMVCDMKGFLDNVVDSRFGGGKMSGTAQIEDKQLFLELVKVEEKLDKTQYTEARKPFRSRAGLRLIMMLQSILP